MQIRQGKLIRIGKIICLNVYFTEILFVVETEQTQLIKTEQMPTAIKCNHPFETQSVDWLILE